MAYPVVSGQRVRAAECLLFRAKSAPDFLLASVVDRVLVTSEIVGPRKDGTARLASTGVDAVTPMRPRLAVEQARAHANVWHPRAADALRLPVALTLVLLQKRGCLKPHCAAVIRACVSSTISTGPDGTISARRCVRSGASRA